jgi:hypothetical protein
MPAPKSQEEIIGTLRLLPPELINFLSSTDVADAIESIEIDYDLEPEMTSRLLNTIAWYTTGFLSASELGSELAKIAPQGKFAEFRSDVIKKIFMPFATQLHEHGLNFEAILSTAAAPSAAPQPAPVSPMQEASPPTPAKPSPPPIVISVAPQQPAPAPIIIQAPAASAKQETPSTASPPLTKAPTTIPVSAQAPIPAPTQPVSVPSPAPVAPAPAAAPKPSAAVSATTPVAIPPKPATTQLPTAAPKITIAGQQPGVPTAPIQEETPQKTQPEITPKAIRYTPAPVIREVPKVISPTDGKKPQEPQQQIAPQQIPPQQSKPQSPVIDLSTFQIIQNAPPLPAPQNKAQPSAPSMSPGTPSAQPKAKGNMIDLKGSAQNSKP